ncbi:hypothetical protein A4A49_21737 [Nicotiana attenuata]|uniref:Uncharacterized protein n=1 Tax=Nicotiana attenuata TaxID=49451 RepID=A0A1J6IJE6_NICAT|nr:hypothetical protein A4A49_21737 [Nicotiana attenuata]
MGNEPPVSFQSTPTNDTTIPNTTIHACPSITTCGHTRATLRIQPRTSIAPIIPLHAQASPYHPLTPPTSPLQHPSPPPDELDEIAQLEVAATMAEIQETLPILCYINGNKTYTLKEQYERKVVITCPPKLLSVSLNIRPTRNPEVGKFAIVLIPARVNRSSTMETETPHSPLNNQSMQFVICNCRGAQSPELKHNFRSMLNYHKPALVALLETHMQDHETLKSEFGFSHLAQSPTEGISGGIALLGRLMKLS